MKNKFISLLIIQMMLISCGSISPKKSSSSDTAIYSISVPNKMNFTNEVPKKILLDSKKQVHLIDFGRSSTITSWKIYDWMAYHGSDSQLPIPLIQMNFKENEKRIINISSLKQGKYMISYVAEAEGCNFELTIE